jgi:hypothetical protein
MLLLKQLRRQIRIPSFLTVSTFVLMALCELLASVVVENTTICCTQFLVWKKLEIAFYVLMKLLVALISLIVQI